MKELMSLLRAMQIYAQHAHHLVCGQSFHSDHEFFKEVYEAVAKDFDDVSERIVGLYGREAINLPQTLQYVSTKLATCPQADCTDNVVFYQFLMQLEMQLCEIVYKICQKNPSKGTEQLITEICNKSEERQYKIKSRCLSKQQ